jgi:hypothetical protein
LQGTDPSLALRMTWLRPYYGIAAILGVLILMLSALDLCNQGEKHAGITWDASDIG